MLNISKSGLYKKVSLEGYKSTEKVFHKRHYKHFNQFLKVFAIVMVIILFLPWTQNVSGRGFLTTLRPDQRPQTIQSQIPGRIESWYVQEGDYVKKGDTILFISEIKSEYFDPLLVERTGDQIRAKSASVVSYEGKVNALNNQVGALGTERGLKLEQARNKLLQSKGLEIITNVALRNKITDLYEDRYQYILTFEKERIDYNKVLLETAMKPYMGNEKLPLDIMPISLSNKGSNQTLINIGNTYRKLTDENNKIYLEELLFEDRVIPDNEIKNLLKTKVTEDFDNGNTILIDGWLLSITEARQCALLSIAEEK